MLSKRLQDFLDQERSKRTPEELAKTDKEFRDMMTRHETWIQTPEGILEVLADPDVAIHPHLSPTFLYRDPDLTHEEKLKCYRDYKDYYERKGRE